MDETTSILVTPASGTARATLQQALLAHLEHRYAEAETLYVQALDQDPGQLTARVRYALLLAQQGQPGRGRDELLRAYATDPAGTSARIDAARQQAPTDSGILALLGFLDQARNATLAEQTLPATDRYPPTARTADSVDVSDGAAGATALIETLSVLQPTDTPPLDSPNGGPTEPVARHPMLTWDEVQAYFAESDASVAAGDFPIAIARLLEVRRLYRNNDEIEQRLQTAREALRNRNLATIYVEQADLKADQGDIPGAQAVLEMARRVDPHHPQVADLQARLERERAEDERRAQARADQANQAQEQLARERADRDRAEQDRLAQEQARLEQERRERERAAVERHEQAERARIEQLEREVEALRLARERLAQEQLEHEQIEAERHAQARRILEQIGHERAERERLESELAQMRLERERADQARLELEHTLRGRQEEGRLAVERAEQDRAERERLTRELDQARRASEQAEQVRLERVRLALAQAEHERRERERLDRELVQAQTERERLQHELSMRGPSDYAWTPQPEPAPPTTEVQRLASAALAAWHTGDLIGCRGLAQQAYELSRQSQASPETGLTCGLIWVGLTWASLGKASLATADQAQPRQAALDIGRHDQALRADFNARLLSRLTHSLAVGQTYPLANLGLGTNTTAIEDRKLVDLLVRSRLTDDERHTLDQALEARAHGGLSALTLYVLRQVINLRYQHLARPVA